MTPVTPHSKPSPDPLRGSRLTVPASPDHLSELVAFVLEQGAAAGLPPGRLPALELVLEEAAVNVMTHAYGGSAGTLEVSCRADADCFVLELCDEGTPFDPTAAADPDTTLPLEERTAGGLGLLLIRRNCDSLAWRREGGKNVLTCGFRREPDIEPSP